MSAATARERRPQVMIVGYGNELRGDDAVGALVASAVTTWELPDVTALVVHQLTPELAAVVAESEHVYFVDAWQTPGDDDPRLKPLKPTSGPLRGAHSGEPELLLALAEALYGHRPQAWQLLIPASEFGYGAPLSPTSSRGMLLALRLLRDIVRELRRSARCARPI